MRNLLLYLLLMCSIQMTGEPRNPFTQFVGKPYAAYHYALRDSLRHRYKSRDLKFVKLSAWQMRILPDVFHDGQWQLEADYLLTNFDHDWQDGSDTVFVKRLEELLSRSKEYSNTIWQIRILRRLFDFYHSNDIVKAVAIGRQLEKTLEKVTIKEYPDVIDNKYLLAEFCLEYHSYRLAEKYYKEVIAMPVFAPNQRISILALNDMGILCREYHHDLNRSDYYFKSIFAFDKKYRICEIRMHRFAIAYGELGRNQYLRHHYNEAVLLLCKSMAIMRTETNEDTDHDHVTLYKVACTLAECLCVMHQYDRALKCIRIADNSFNLIPDSTASRQDYFTAMSKYYVGIGDTKAAAAYMDSTVRADNEWNQRHNADLFYEIERHAGRHEYQQMSMENENNYHKYVVFLLISVVVLLLLASYVYLYYEKRKAYRALVVKNQQWAENRRLPMISAPQKKKSEEDNKLYADIEKHLETTKCYCNPDLTLDMLAKDLGVNRTYISNAINKTDENFNAMINRFRVRLAVQILSQHQDSTMEGLAYDVGFNNRRSFYNAFMKITGLSPAQFKSNMQ
jgi:AraC-like DNA-binding protein